ncbi:MAG TPA: DUF1801 domain-containing protein [Candidatus Limnocylindrales bacterium]|nr:DUF1801 domain-containing protein [Candidatus Limnocylindrales bacterium]
MTRTTEAEVQAFLKDYPPEIRAVALRARQLLATEMPDAVEQVKPGWKVMQYGANASMQAQLIVIQPQANWVNLGFAHGSELPDPVGLLEGTGKGIRHVKLRTVKDVEREPVRALVKAEVRIAEAGR